MRHIYVTIVKASRVAGMWTTRHRRRTKPFARQHRAAACAGIKHSGDVGQPLQVLMLVAEGVTGAAGAGVGVWYTANVAAPHGPKHTDVGAVNEQR